MRLNQLKQALIKLITVSQKKIIIRGLIALLVFLILWVFVYSPSKNQVKAIKLKLLNIESEIKGIEAMAGGATIRGETIKSMRQRLQALKDKFPAEEEGALSMLSDFAQKLNIELISIKPQPKKIFLDEHGKEIVIEGRVPQTVFVSLRLRCSYEDLVKYIEVLRQDLPGFITVERLNISKDRSGKTARLDAVLNFNLYFLSRR